MIDTAKKSITNIQRISYILLESMIFIIDIIMTIFQFRKMPGKPKIYFTRVNSLNPNPFKSTV